MTLLKTTGYQKDQTGSWIEKDSSAQLTYSMDWSQWLQGSDTISTVEYSVSPSTDINDVHIVNSGVQIGYLTYAELSKGRNGEIYTIAAKITTNDGKIDTRRFRIKVKDRYL